MLHFDKRRIQVWLGKSIDIAQEVVFWFKRYAQHFGVLAAVVFLVSAWLWFGVHEPPSFFPVRSIVSIPEGTTLREAAQILKDKQVVRNAAALVLAVHLAGKDADIRAGDYYFDTQLTLPEVVRRITLGVYGLEPVRVTIPEGATTYQMAQLFDEKFERFDAASFMVLAKDKEGYLFPDTYFFLPTVTTTEILETMERTFYERLRTLDSKIATFGHPVHEVITMASLLEKEARDFDQRRTIAGVLWKRLQIHMPLQVDAVFGFIEKTDTFSPKFSHLEIDSLYNTYKNMGLPPGPIGSPSLASIEAAVTPMETDALFYLHGRDGVLRIAQTYEQHLQNRRRYLD